jgi:hypothetical protein
MVESSSKVEIADKIAIQTVATTPFKG